MCVYMYVHMCVGMWACVHVLEPEEKTSGVLLNHSLPEFLTESGAYVLEGGGLANELQRSACIFLHDARDTGT